MFGNLRTGTKLFILSGMFIVSIAVATYSLIADKVAAVNFARKELAGSHYLAIVRDTYGTVATGLTDDAAYRRSRDRAEANVAALAAAQTAAVGTLQTADLAKALDAALGELLSAQTAGGTVDAAALRALVAARSLAARISDDSNLALDTDLDSYHLVIVVVDKLPPVFGALAEAHTLIRLGATEGGISIDRGARLLALASMIRSTADEIDENLAAAYRGNADGTLQARLAPTMAATMRALNAYLSVIDARFAGATRGDNDDAGLARAYASAIERMLAAWSSTQSELDRLLDRRIGRLTAGMARSLALIGVLIGLSILLLVMTHRHIVRPLERLERLARRVRETKDYGLRFEHANQDEIGRVAGAFNGMLAELSAAHELDVAHQVRAAEDALGLLVGVTAAASSAPTEAALASACLEQICRSCEWQFGQVWYPDEQDRLLHCSAHSFFGSRKYAALRELSLRTTLTRGQGLPGQVWENNRAVWISSRVEREENLPRLQASRALGFKAAFAFPVILDDKVLAVFEFLSEHTRAPERAFLDSVEKLGRILGDSLVRKRSVAALRASEERWRSVFENSTFGVTLIDRSSLRYLTTNAAFQAMMGYTDAELRERTAMDISLDADKERSRTLLTELSEGKRQRYVIVKQYRRKDGTLMWGESYVSVIPGGDGKPLMFLGSTVDISERKRAEDALQSTQAELARVQRLTIMGEITASIAHEINQPLAAIVTNANSGLRWLGNKTPDLGEAQSALRRIVSDGHRAGDVIGSIRAMFKNGRRENAYYDVNALIREVLALVHGELESNKVETRVELSEGMPKVLADRVQLQQVVLNLMMNAIEAMGSMQNGGARILGVNSELRDRRDILITVKDSGPGIDPQNIDRIFDRFFTTKANGMGMGLSICRSIVEAHNGRLWAEPDVGPGSVFRILLPVDGAAARG
jgi:PAS domain S-box-containing protein